MPLALTQTIWDTKVTRVVSDGNVTPCSNASCWIISLGRIMDTRKFVHFSEKYRSKYRLFEAHTDTQNKADTGRYRYIVISLVTVSGFSWGRLRSAPSALHFVPLCLQSALSRRPKLRFGKEKLINSTLFAASGNALELISNGTAEVDFCWFDSGTLDNPKNSLFSGLSWVSGSSWQK